MDTRFWGPSGWKLLHLVTFDYARHNKTSRSHPIKNYRAFFQTLPYILPCKFCRSSLTDYYRQNPFRASQDMRKWMYDIHNCVNDKLRKQGLHPSSNPPYHKVKEFYEAWLECDWQTHLVTFWDFLFAVAYNHPQDTHSQSAPMPDCPPEVHRCKDKCEKNKWNVLPLKDRLYWFTRFWSYLPVVLPSSMGNMWKEAQKTNPPTLGCRSSTLAWLWRMRCALDADFQDPYTSVCKRIATYSSDCAKKKRAITCRRRKAPTERRKAKATETKRRTKRAK